MAPRIGGVRCISAAGHCSLQLERDRADTGTVGAVRRWRSHRACASRRPAIAYDVRRERGQKMGNEYERGALGRKRSTFVAAKEAAQRLLALYETAGVSLSPQCSLGLLIRDAIALADSWLAGNIVDDTDPLPLIRGQHLDKIAWAALPLQRVESSKPHLLALKRGTLDPLDRSQSSAKDKLWELELWTALNEYGIPATLAEPDIVASTPSGNIAIACKRIYSLANAASSMSKGVAQVEAAGLTGVLAVNIDDIILPAGNLLGAPDIKTAAGKLNAYNRAFIATYHQALHEYVSTGRVAAVMVSASAPVYLENEGIRECRQMQFWTHPQLDQTKKLHIKEFEDQMFSGAARLDLVSISG
jgi:hypothetical protein